MEKEKSDDGINDLHITKSALTKAHIYAKKIREVHGKDLECYFFLISPANKKDRIARDIYFPRQEATSASVHIDEDVIVDIGKELREKGLKILGWSHSHSIFHTFHSGTDDENHISVLNEISSDNYIEFKNEKDMFRHGIDTNINKNIVVISDKTRNIELILDVSGKFNGKVLSSKLNAPIKVGFAYSLVVNADDNLKPHCEVAIKEFCPLYLREKEVETYKVPIKIIENDDYPIIVDENKIKEEIKEKVSMFTFGGSFFDYREKERAKKRSVSYGELGQQSDGVFTKEQVEEMLLKQREELQLQSQNRIKRILKDIFMASPFGALYKWYKKIFATGEYDEYLPSPEELEEEIKMEKLKRKEVKSWKKR